MDDVVTVDPTQLRRELFESLLPLIRRCERQGIPIEDLALFVRPWPVPGETIPGARIFVKVEHGSEARMLTEGLVRDMPDPEAVTAAVERVLALGLAALDDPAAAEGAAQAQADGRHVTMLVCRPDPGSVDVVQVAKDGKVLVLGRLCDAPARVH